MDDEMNIEQINALTNGQTRINTKLEGVDKRLENLEETVKDIPVALGELRVVLSNFYDGCPHREEIARGQNNVQKMKEVEKEVKDLADKENNDIAALKKAQSDAKILSVKNLAKLALVVMGGATVGANINLSGLLSLFG